ncbi:MAG: glycosyltransferase family 2 protein [Paeniclostridium sordellii]|nr:glycosyltransferase family 2 protein [Paeniclostridium sordellii]
MKISIIIPIFNSKSTIKRCLDSVISQTYYNWEIIAIDDGSTDSSYMIICEYMKKDSRIKVFTQENKGPGLARNKGIEHATGEYIVFLDSDDYIDKSYFKELKKCIDEKKSDVIFIDVVQETCNGKVLKYDLMSKYKGKGKKVIIRHQMTGKLPWGGCRKAVKASLIKENNILYSPDEVGEEAIFSYRVLDKAKNIDFIEQPYYHYINYTDSQSKKGSDDPWGIICQKMKKHLQENNCIDEYYTTINSFALTSCIIYIYRVSQKYKFKKSIQLSRKKLNAFKKDYGFELDKDSLENRVKYMIPLIKLNQVYLIVLISKVKSMLEKVK